MLDEVGRIADVLDIQVNSSLGLQPHRCTVGLHGYRASVVDFDGLPSFV